MNMIYRKLNCYDQFITVGSSQDFKYGHLNISPIYPDISRIFYRKIKLTCACATDLIFPQYIGPKPIYWRYIADIGCIADIVSNIIDIGYIGDISTDISDIFIPAYNISYTLGKRK